MDASDNSNFKIMLVEDSSMIRGYISRVLSKEPGLEVVAEAKNGQEAVDIVGQHKPHVIILDVEMPVMDGLTALPLLLEKSPDSRIIMVSSLTRKNAAISIKAMANGASDFVEKPSADTDNEGFKKELIEKVKILASSASHTSDREFKSIKFKPVPEFPAKDEKIELKQATLQTTPNVYTPNIKAEQPIGTQAPKQNKIPLDFRPDVLAIGSSTGGPQALVEIFKAIGTSIKHIPIFITQHMPPTFTTFLASSIATASGAACMEPTDGQIVEPGNIYLAPGDYHMIVQQRGVDRVIRLTQDAQENFCRPSVDPMLRSLVDVYGKNILTVMLTGMGQDGMLGAKQAHEKGGIVLIQDEASSVVWGMPGAIANEGFQNGEFPLMDIGPQIMKLCNKGVL